MTEPLVQANDLSVLVGGRAVIDTVGFELRAGERLGVVGPSGSGKSTLARALVGLEAMTGSLIAGGTELVRATASQRRAWQRRVQLCWQDATSALDPLDTVRAIIDDARTLAGRSAWSDAAHREALRALDLPPDCGNVRSNALSGGQRQRVGLARALATEPELLIADEITSALDPPRAWSVIDEVVRWSERCHGAVVIVAHDVALLAAAVHHIVVLDAGRIVETGPPDRVLGAPVHPVTRALVAAVARLPTTPR